MLYVKRSNAKIISTNELILNQTLFFVVVKFSIEEEGEELSSY